MHSLDEGSILKLMAYADHELGPEEAREVEDRLLRDEEAQSFVKAMRTLNEILHAYSGKDEKPT